MPLDPRDLANPKVSVDAMLKSEWFWVSYEDKSDGNRFLGLVIAPGNSPQGATKFVRETGLMPVAKRKGALRARVYPLGSPPIISMKGGMVMEVPISMRLRLLGEAEIPRGWLR